MIGIPYIYDDFSYLCTDHALHLFVNGAMRHPAVIFKGFILRTSAQAIA